MLKNTPPPRPPQTSVVKNTRSSNLELYRIVCMLMIVAHHYVVNSGLTDAEGPLQNDITSWNSIFLALFGAWGKTGINCFVLITGYFMCKSKITVRKFLKLLLQIYFYKLVVYMVFYCMGYETFSIGRVIKLILPFSRLGNNFTGCFLVFYLTIPFWTILIHNINRRQHELLLLLLLSCYTVLGSIPSFEVTFNYISWFGILFLISSYIRLYDKPVFNNGKLWGILTLISVIVALMSIILSPYVFNGGSARYMWVADSNKILSLCVAVCSFLWFKNMEIPKSKLINAIGGSAFGVLLIHANSNAMRTWLWHDTVDSVGHYFSMGTVELILYSAGVVLAIFIVCNLIDQFRIATFEKWFFNWYDRKMSVKADAFMNRIISV